MGSILRGVLPKILAIIDESANYSVLIGIYCIFLKHVLEGANDRSHRLISYLYTSGVNPSPLELYSYIIMHEHFLLNLCLFL